MKSSESRPGNDQVMVNKELGCNMTFLMEVISAMEREDGENSPFLWESVRKFPKAESLKLYLKKHR